MSKQSFNLRSCISQLKSSKHTMDDQEKYNSSVIEAAFLRCSSICIIAPDRISRKKEVELENVPILQAANENEMRVNSISQENLDISIKGHNLSCEVFCLKLTYFSHASIGNGVFTTN